MHLSEAQTVYCTKYMMLKFTCIFSVRKTISHDWDEVFKEGKTMLRLPKECITGHVEGGTIIHLLLICIASQALFTVTTYACMCFWQVRLLRCWSK